jgi:hypothetical protein
MSEFLNNLAARSLGLAGLVQPRIRSLFEPHSADTRIPERLSVRSSAEAAAVRLEESSQDFPTELARPPASILGQSLQGSIKPSVRLPGDAPPDQTRANETTTPHRVEPARAEAMTIANSPASKAPVDSVKMPAFDRKAEAGIIADSSPSRTIRDDARQQKADEQRLETALQPDIRRLVDEQVSRIEARALPVAPRVETAAEHQPPAVSPSRTIAPAQPAPLAKPPASRQPTQSVPSQPEIKITIGRVDVRAVMPAQPVARSQPVARIAPTSLDDYLKERSGGRR